ncbi:hypothetical protein Kpol_1018p19 [Vanderwaltozyma polyspora DSM 70294]|uniref:G1/S-specific cyclin n=1 Tax=Vanderwaltozyma polyspora (strain ATCC 22028 / DSM 70294 / BCRC 21397 / CBS 2163 / NBRC 10782 / NRRL Y-8283 / UCD 57-17) TaxID=436907 RepID=A7TDM1_VANPO|nr:uncharacterized protein Kpol_1018p19 [Vanderwaltozyma polyspora DSM 70294]EDO19491.1 hypothetical protein Kpol_1018p19 [Vanderwaltozyma polyspora DSM 70294]
MTVNQVKPGLIVTARQTYYPIELSNTELLAHYEMIQEYHQSISTNILNQSAKYKPDIKLIDQQPEMNPFQTRSVLITYLYEISVMSRVSDGIFYHAARLYDRYCSKRVVLRDQAKFVVTTCLWLAAKTWGGCNHIINNVCVPTGGRFYGPTKRARIPRLSELVHYCGGPDSFDESMFIQMERHILNTLDWTVYEPMISDFVLNVDENCLIQYELYKRQLEAKKNSSEKRQSQSSQDSDATVEDSNSEEMVVEDQDLEMKIQLIHLKRFLIDLATWQYDLLKFELHEVSDGIFAMIRQFTMQEQGPLIMTPVPSKDNQLQILKIFITAVVNTPNSLYEIYNDHDGINEFINNVTNYHTELQRKIQLATSMDVSRRNISMNSSYFDHSAYMNSPTCSTQSSTPLRNTSAFSENSVFSTSVEQSSPITPQNHGFGQFIIDNNSTNGSVISLSSIPQVQRGGAGPGGANGNCMANEEVLCIKQNPIYKKCDSNKENMLPFPQQCQQKPRIVNGIFSSPHNLSYSSNSSDRSSIGSFAYSSSNGMN